MFVEVFLVGYNCLESISDVTERGMSGTLMRKTKLLRASNSDAWRPLNIRKLDDPEGSRSLASHSRCRAMKHHLFTWADVFEFVWHHCIIKTEFSSAKWTEGRNVCKIGLAVYSQVYRSCQRMTQPHKSCWNGNWADVCIGVYVHLYSEFQKPNVIRK